MRLPDVPDAESGVRDGFASNDGFVESLLKLVGLDWPVPDDSTLSRRQKTLNVAITHCQSAELMHILIDCTGIKVEGDGEWQARKHGLSKCRRWLKLHLGIDTEALEVQAVEITGAGVGDAPAAGHPCCPSC